MKLIIHERLYYLTWGEKNRARISRSGSVRIDSFFLYISENWEESSLRWEWSRIWIDADKRRLFPFPRASKCVIIAIIGGFPSLESEVSCIDGIVSKGRSIETIEYFSQRVFSCSDFAVAFEMNDYAFILEFLAGTNTGAASLVEILAYFWLSSGCLFFSWKSCW